MTLRSFAPAAVIAAIALQGCGHPVKKRLEGRWQGQSVENVDDEMRAAATGWARGTSVEFAGSSITITLPVEDPRTAEYEVVSADGRTVTLGIRGRNGVERTRFFLDEERSMRWDVGQGRTIVLVREL